MTQKQAGEMLGLSHVTVSRMVRDGRIKLNKIGQIPMIARRSSLLMVIVDNLLIFRKVSHCAKPSYLPMVPGGGTGHLYPARLSEDRA